MRIVTTLAATVVAATLTLGGAASAQAETQVRNDPAGDTVNPFVRASPQSSADVVRLTGTHGDGRLKFTFDLVDLTPDEQLSVSARILTAGGRDYYLSLTRSSGGKSVSLVRNDGDGNELPCEGATGSILNAKDRAIVSIPRSCVANPRSVRFGGGVYATPGFGRRGIPSAAADDARRNGSVGEDLKLGTRALANN